jgi:hypothetical protein
MFKTLFRAIPALVAGAAISCMAAAVGPAQAGAVVGTQAFQASATLDGRTVKDVNNHAYPNKYPAGSYVSVTCQDTGPDAYGSTIWDRTTDSLWVPDFYLKTGHSGFVDSVPRCVGGTNPGTGTGRPLPITATLDGRTAKDVNNHAYPNKYPSGSTVWITCQDSGPSAYGSSIWDRTQDNLWVPDYYVTTGFSGFDPYLPRCSADEPPGGAPTSFKVSATLDGRTIKDVNNHAFPNLYVAGQYVPLTCQDTGPSAYGSTIWDLTKDSLWIPDYYVSTGSSGFSSAIPRCTGQPTSHPGGGFSYVVSTTLDGRSAKDTSNHAAPDKYPAGSTVTISCQAYGGATYGGSAIWDKTTDGLWIVDYYVKTGTDGFVSGIPRCDNDQPPAAPGPPTPGGSNTAPSGHQDQVNATIAAARQATRSYPDYTYGGGHGAAPGPSHGACSGGNGYLNGVCVASSRTGFDCSGLMRWSFYQGTGVDLGGSSTFGWYSGWARSMPSIFGSRVSRVQDLQPGDLVLAIWEGGGPGHTFLISAVQPASGTVTLIEAPRTSIPLREITKTYADLDFVVGYRLK